MVAFFSDEELLVWVRPEALPPREPLVAHLKKLGLAVRHCLPGQSAGVDATMMLIQTQNFREASAIVQELRGTDLPTLVVTEDAEDEALWLARVGEMDDVVSGLHHSGLVIQRLIRMARSSRRFQLPLEPRGNGSPASKLSSLLSHDEWSEQLMLRLVEIAEHGDTHCHGVVLLDVDYMDQLNATHGHETGNQALEAVAERLALWCRPGDHVGHYDGDSFAILMRRYDTETLESDVHHIVAAFGAGLQLPSGRRLPFSVSAGLNWIQAHVDFDEVLNQLDHALLRAKREGRNRLVIYGDGDGRLRKDRHLGLDPLTQAHNRLYLEEKLARECDSASRRGRHLSLAFLDLKELRRINETHGHRIGDQMLRRLADLIRRCARTTDWVARYKGGCLCLVMPDTSIEDARLVRDRLMQAAAVEAIQDRHGEPVQLEFTLGLAAHRQGMKATELLLQAEQECHRQRRGPAAPSLP